MTNSKLPLGLLSLRIGTFIVFFMWALQKFMNPAGAAAVFKKYYKIEGLAETMPYVIGGLQMVLLFLFLFGIWKTWTYGAIFILHLISTLSTIPNMLDPWKTPNLLFYAAIPMLSGIFTLWLLRREDVLMTIGKK